MKNILLTLCLFTSSFCGAQDYIDSLRQRLLKVESTALLPGFAVAVIQNGEINYQEAFGFADIESKTPYELHTVQNIGSISKTFVGVGLMKAVEEGYLKLDDPVNDYLPFKVNNPRFPETAITFRHLATHTSGILDSKTYYTNAYVITGEIPDNKKDYKLADKIQLKLIKKSERMPYDQFLKKYLIKGGDYYKKKHFSKDAPGQVYEYTNVGATLLAYAIEEATGQAFMGYSQKHILDPLGMKDSGWSFESVNMNMHSTVYLPYGPELPRYTLNTWPDGGMISSCADMSLYLLEIMEGYKKAGSLLNKEAYNEMLSLQFEQPGQQVGIIWDIARSGKIGHNGGDPGIFTFIEFNPELDLGVVFLTNSSAYEEKEPLGAFVEIWKSCWGYGKKMIP